MVPAYTPGFAGASRAAFRGPLARADRRRRCGAHAAWRSAMDTGGAGRLRLGGRAPRGAAVAAHDGGRWGERDPLARARCATRALARPDEGRSGAHGVHLRTVDSR